MEKREPSCAIDGNVNYLSHYGERYGSSLKNLKRELPYDLAILLLGIYPKETTIQKDHGPQQSLQHYLLFTIVRAWKQTQCQLKDKWTKNT